MPRRAGTAHGPAAPWVMAHPGSIHLPTHSLLTCQPTGFPVTQILMAKESVICETRGFALGEPEDKASWLFPQINLSSLEANVGAATQPAATGCLAQVPRPSSALSPPKTA